MNSLRSLFHEFSFRGTPWLLGGYLWLLIDTLKNPKLSCNTVACKILRVLYTYFDQLKTFMKVYPNLYETRSTHFKIRNRRTKSLKSPDKNL